MSERAARAKKWAARSAPAAQETASVAHAAQRTPVQRPVAAAADADTVSPRPQGDQRKANYDAGREHASPSLADQFEDARDASPTKGNRGGLVAGAKRARKEKKGNKSWHFKGGGARG